MSIILSLDVGTGSLKAGLMDTDAGRWLAVASRRITTHHHDNRAEQDAREYESAAVAAIAELRTRAPCEISRLRAISVTGQMRSVVLVGADHEPLGPVLTLYDRRAERECAEFVSEFGIPAIHRITGQRFDIASTPAKLRWLSRHEPQRLSACWKIFAPKDYLRLRMTGAAATDPIDASGWLLFDLNQERWHEKLVQFSGFRPEQLPEIAPTCSTAGTLLPELADEWGLPHGVVVAVGGGDDIAATGCGAIEPGDVYEHIGSTGSIFVVCDRPILDPQQIIECYPTETKGRYWLGGSCNSAGVAIEHALRQSPFCSNEKTDWVAVTAAMACWDNRSPQDRPLYLPYIAGERCPIWNSALRAGWADANLENTAQDWAIAAHEGPAMVLAWILQEVERLTCSPRRIYSAGKAGEDESYGRLRATIYGCPVTRFSQPDAALLAAAAIGAVVAGESESVTQLVRRCLEHSWVATPDVTLITAYGRRLQQFQERTRDLISCTIRPDPGSF